MPLYPAIGAAEGILVAVEIETIRPEPLGRLYLTLSAFLLLSLASVGTIGAVGLGRWIPIPISIGVSAVVSALASARVRLTTAPDHLVIVNRFRTYALSRNDVQLHSDDAEVGLGQMTAIALRPSSAGGWWLRLRGKLVIEASTTTRPETVNHAMEVVRRWQRGGRSPQ